MTKKHFEQAADIVRSSDREHRAAIAEAFVKLFARTTRASIASAF